MKQASASPTKPAPGYLLVALMVMTTPSCETNRLTIARQDGAWMPLFDGNSLRNWKMTDFPSPGPVTVKNGKILLSAGQAMTGITWTGDFPRQNYEVRLKSMRVDGSDFFCCLTFPVGQGHCSLVLGGWGGSLVGLSSIDGLDASENETTESIEFENGRPYAVKLSVSKEKIEVWLDDENIIDQAITDQEFSVRLEVEESLPFGIASYSTDAALWDLAMRTKPGKTSK